MNLKDWAERTNRFMTIKDGEEFIGRYEGYTISMSTFDPSKETISYKLDGKIWNCSNQEFARVMHEVPINSMVKITRKGQRFQTKYEVEVL